MSPPAQEPGTIQERGSGMKSWTAPGLDMIHSYLLHSVSQLLASNQTITNDPGLLTSPPGDGSKLVNPGSDGPDQEGTPRGT